MPPKLIIRKPIVFATTRERGIATSYRTVPSYFFFFQYRLGTVRYWYRVPQVSALDSFEAAYAVIMWWIILFVINTQYYRFIFIFSLFFENKRIIYLCFLNIKIFFIFIL